MQIHLVWLVCLFIGAGAFSSSEVVRAPTRSRTNWKLTVAASNENNIATTSAATARNKLLLLQESLADAIGDLPVLNVAALKRSAFKLGTRAVWKIPLILCLIPLCGVLIQQPIHFPDWWKMVDLTSMKSCSVFLLSNMSYLAAGGRLLQRYPPLLTNSSLYFTRHSGLGAWVWLAGAISTIFHSLQTIRYDIAEAWCWLDHGVALTAAAYFVVNCGLPSRKVWAVGLLGLACLVNPLPRFYAETHAIWHVLSATAAVWWGRQAERKHALERAWIVQRQEIHTTKDYICPETS